MNLLLSWLPLLLPAPFLAYGLLLWVVPAGNLLHEAIWLPVLWVRILTSDRSGLRETKWRYGRQRRQYLLSFQPPTAAPRPLTVIYFHGGGWRLGSPEHFRGNAKVLTQAGYHVILPSYRRLPWNNYRQIREDLAMIWPKIEEVLRAEGQEGNDIVLAGMSAGGHLAAMLAFDPYLRRQSNGLADRIAGLVLMGSPLDLDRMPPSRPIRQLAGPRDGELFRIANPIRFLAPGLDIPTLFIHGDKDAMVPLASARAFEAKMKAVGHTDVAFHQMRGGSHLDAVVWSHTDGDQRQLLLHWLSERGVVGEQVGM